MAEILSMDYGWRFCLGDVLPAKVEGHLATYYAVQAGGARGAADPSFDDSAWREVDVPHDWAAETPYCEEENSNHGYKPRGIAWYRKTFRLPEEYDGKLLYLEFGSVITHCKVWVNGQLLCRNFCGYTGFVVDFTSIARFGAKLNTIAVRVDAEAFEAWSYEGAGINRHVDLHVADMLSIKPMGVHVNPVKTADGWDTQIRVDIQNRSEKDCEVMVVSTITGPYRDPSAAKDGNPPPALPDLRAKAGFDAVGKNAGGKSAGTAEGLIQIGQGGERAVDISIPVSDPSLWSVDEPSLYMLRTEILRGGLPADSADIFFGYRTIRFDAGEGFFLNGLPLKIKGTCNHQDHAGLGSALPDSMFRFRIEKLKEMGCNAYRCAHHPPAKEFLDACDRMGMLVMDENRNFGDSPEHTAQLEAMVVRDRNHPSVILWSLFNEESLQTTRTGRKITQNMARAVRRLDGSRPVMAAINEEISDREGAMDALDVVGINYFQFQYDDFHRMFPDKPLIASEANCAYGTRGVYESDAGEMRFASDDTESTPFGSTARKSWQEIDSRPFIGGVFIWAGFDYKGEPFPYKWPSVSSHHGNIDVCGFPKSGYYLHQAYWTDSPMLHILPHWNLPGAAGKDVRVQVYTNCGEAELFQDGLSLGRKPVGKYDMAAWDVRYTPGRLHAVGYINGKAAAEGAAETADEPCSLELIPWRRELVADGTDAIPVTVRAVDAKGRFVPAASDMVKFCIEGGAKILGVGNGDPTCHEPDKAESRSLFGGLCQVIIQSGFKHGEAMLTARAWGLRTAELKLTLRESGRRPYIPSQAHESHVTEMS